jgi:hypothetical protein
VNLNMDISVRNTKKKKKKKKKKSFDSRYQCHYYLKSSYSLNVITIFSIG